MSKREIKENLKQFQKIAEENEGELRVLDILNQSLPTQGSLNKSQEYIQKNVNLYTKEKVFSFNLEDGPYKGTYTQNGSHFMIYNKTGSISSFSTQSFNLSFESNIEDTIYDARFLHNEQYMALAQKDCVFVYDNTGKELHAVRDLKNTKMLEFLPYHFLLVGATDAGFMNYFDTSTGEIASNIFIKDKNPTILKSNPANAIIHLGSNRGQVSLWAPSQKSYLMKVNCHKSAISTIEIDRSGQKMVTTGLDNKLKVFDIRNTYSPLKTVQTKANIHFTSLSQRGLLALAYSNKLVVLKNFDQVYLKHNAPDTISSLEFCNHEDILSIGHAKGICSIVVPGSGDPMYDSKDINPYMTKNERQNLEVTRLLNKIPADLISLKPILGELAATAHVANESHRRRYFEDEESPRNALSRFYGR